MAKSVAHKLAVSETLAEYFATKSTLTMMNNASVTVSLPSTKHLYINRIEKLKAEQARKVAILLTSVIKPIKGMCAMYISKL